MVLGPKQSVFTGWLKLNLYMYIRIILVYTGLQNVAHTVTSHTLSLTVQLHISQQTCAS